MTTDDVDAALRAPGRLDALGRIGLDAAADPTFDRFAQMVRGVIGVPVALVTLVDPERQFFPGACGLGDPWQQLRQTPLSHSFCQHVVATAEPLIVTDARTDPRVAGNLAIDDLGVIGYAGMPLTDADGNVLGSLCAIDTEPRTWTSDELDLLADLAAACSDSLRLRIATQRAETAEQIAVAAHARAGAAYDRSQLLLRASAALADTTGFDDVLATLRHLAIGTLDPAHVGVFLLEPANDQVTSYADEALPADLADRWADHHRTGQSPAAVAAATGELVLFSDPSTATPEVADTMAALGWQSAASAPLPGQGGAIGALTFAWKQPHVLDTAEQVLLGALAGHVARAIDRANVFDDRRAAAETLQKALLTSPPAVDGVRLATRYEAAHHADYVGGDWYDAIAVDRTRLALVIGDVTGHSVEAAAGMSQYRSLLRGLVIDRHEPPSALIRRLERTTRSLGGLGMATVILAYLDRAPSGEYTLTWSNAGHPPPILLHPDGRAETLPGRDPLLGALRQVSRTNHTRVLPAGTRLLLHTDGLIETRTRPLDEGFAELRRRLTAHRHADLEELADLLLEPVGGPVREDDAALLMVET
jgi:GAF domain-containing protein